MWARQLGERAGVTIPLQAAEHYYLHHRADRRHRTAPARCWRTRRSLRLLPRGGRRPDARPVRGRSARRGRSSGIPDDFSFGELPPDWDRMAPYLEKAMSRIPISPRGRHPQVLLRPGELHPRPAAGRRRGAGAAQLLRRGRAQLDRHPHRRRARPRPGALDRRRPPRHRRHRHQHRPAAQLPGQPGVPGAPARSSRSAWSTSATTPTGRCRPRAAPSCRRCTTGSPRSGAYFRDVSGWEGADWYAPEGVEPVAGPS